MSETQTIEKPEDSAPDRGVFHIEPNSLPQLWGLVEPLVEAACAYSNGQYTAQAVLDGVLAGRYVLVGFHEGGELTSVAVLTISQFPSGARICELLLASGERLKDWIEFEELVAAWARGFGCTRFRMIGREGLQRMLKHWKRTAVVLERELGA